MTKHTVVATQVPQEDPIGTLIEICEKLRDLNTDGYIRKSLWLADIKPFKFGRSRITLATVCSPFTGTVCGMLWDPDYPKRDVKKDAYEPKYDDPAKDLPWDFYHVHNDNDQPIESLIKYGLGTQVKRAAEMRRGDLVAIDWVPLPKKKGDPSGGGHVVFCWDVHLNAKGDVDCFQMLGSHGSLKANGSGVHIHGCNGERWLTGKPAEFNKPGTGKMEKAKPKIFVDEKEIVESGTWFALPGVQFKDIDTATFIATPTRISAPGSKTGAPRIGFIKVGRFNYKGKPPDSYATKGGGGGGSSSSGSSSPAPAPKEKEKEKEKPGHADAPVVVVTRSEVKKDHEAVKKVEPRPVKQDPKKPLMMQRDVETAMHEFFHAKWVKADPGVPDEINDAKSQAAVKEFQKLFGLDEDGIVGKITRDEIKKQLPACHRQSLSEELLGDLFRGGKLKKDSGPPTGFMDDETKAAVEEFQGQQGLKKTGVPDADTLTKLQKAIEEHAATPASQGLNPNLDALYWLGNQAAPGHSAKLRLHSEDLKNGQSLKIFLKTGEKEEESESKTTLIAHSAQSEVAVPIPVEFPLGSAIFARVEAKLDGATTLQMSTAAPLYVRGLPVTPGVLEEFFKLSGTVGEGKRDRSHVYVAYKVAGKPGAWIIRGRFMTDVDGAPNCYHPNDKDVRLDYQNFDLEAHQGALDWKKNGGHPGNWFGVVTDTGEKTGTPIIQGPGDPCPGFYVASTSLADKSKKRNDPHRYVDARKIPYLAFNYQVWAESGSRFTRVAPGATGTLGDILTAVNPKESGEHRFHHAVFADIGGADSPHFGEGSPALGKKVQAHGFAEADMVYIVYPHSGAGQGTIPSADEIQAKGQKLFDAWGGTAELDRVLGLLPK